MHFRQLQGTATSASHHPKKSYVRPYHQDVSAGNPQPPFGQSSEKIDLNKLLFTNETATFFCRNLGRSMEPHMRDGDNLMVDKSF